MSGCKRLLIGAAISIIAFLAANGQILHSVDRMAEAIKRKSELATHVKQYIQEERLRLDELEK